MNNVTLKKIQFGLQEVMSPALLEELQVTDENDIMSGRVIRYITWYLWGNRIHKEEKTIRIPDGWWQAFKDAYFHRILRRWFPIKYREIIVETNFNHLCPHLNYKTPRTPRRIHVGFLTSPEKEEHE